jgi:hypothetical protein
MHFGKRGLDRRSPRKNTVAREPLTVQDKFRWIRQALLVNRKSPSGRQRCAD